VRKLSFQSIHKMDRTPIKQSGFSLIEIMVAALILSIGILGLVGLQVIGLKGTQQSSMKWQTVVMLQTLCVQAQKQLQLTCIQSFAVTRRVIAREQAALNVSMQLTEVRLLMVG